MHACFEPSWVQPAWRFRLRLRDSFALMEPREPPARRARDLTASQNSLWTELRKGSGWLRAAAREEERGSMQAGSAPATAHRCAQGLLSSLRCVGATENSLAGATLGWRRIPPPTILLSG